MSHRGEKQAMLDMLQLASRLTDVIGNEILIGNLSRCSFHLLHYKMTIILIFKFSLRAGDSSQTS